MEWKRAQHYVIRQSYLINLVVVIVDSKSYDQQQQQVSAPLPPFPINTTQQYTRNFLIFLEELSPNQQDLAY